MTNTGLMMVNLTMVANIEAASPDHAKQLGTRKIGQRIDDTPLPVVGVAQRDDSPPDG